MKLMLQFIQNHLFQYLLILLLFAVTVTSLMSPINTVYKLIFISMSVLIYFIWSVWHHWENHQMSLSVLLEYLLLISILYWILLNLAI